MPRIGAGILILLVSVVLPGSGMAKEIASLSRQTQMSSQVDNVRADKQALHLTVGELFAPCALPEIACIDSPAQSYIQIEWMPIAEILDDTTGESNHTVEMYPGDFEELCFALSEPSVIGLFLLVAPYRLGIGYYETPLPLL